MASEKDVVYAGAGASARKLDIYRPEGAPRHAAILFFHGGGWRGGAREMMRPIAREMAALGYVGLPVSYRLLGEAPFPAQIADVRAAIRWTRTHANELGIDTDRIVPWGSSAGAHLSLLAAGTPNETAFDESGAAPTTSAAVAGVIAVHPPVEFHTGAQSSRHTTSSASLLGESASEEAARAASPITHVSASFPPTLLLHGTSDRMVNHAASEAMFAALRAAKAPADLRLFHGHTHGFDAIPSVRRLMAAEADYFIDRNILDPAKHEAEAIEHSMFARRAAAERAAANQ